MSWHRRSYRKPFLAGVFALSLMTVVFQGSPYAYATTQRMATSIESKVPNSSGTINASLATSQSLFYFYIHADKIQAQGAFLQPISISGKLGAELRFSELVLYGMRLVKNTSISGSTDAIEIRSTGPVRLNNVTADVARLGFHGAGLKLNVLLPDLELTDVNLMATRLITDEANIPDLSLHANAQPIGVNAGDMIDLSQIPFSGTMAQVVPKLNSLLNGTDRSVSKEPGLTGTVSQISGLLTNGNLQNVLGGVLSSTTKDSGSFNPGPAEAQPKNPGSQTQTEKPGTVSSITVQSNRTSSSSTEQTSQGPGLLEPVIKRMSSLLGDLFGRGS